MKAMADHVSYHSGWVPALISILLGIISKISSSDLAAWISILVGVYTIYINWPKFMNRFSVSWQKFRAWKKKRFKSKK